MGCTKDLGGSFRAGKIELVIILEAYLLGIDGGGSKTEAVLCRTDGCCIARSRLPGCNPNDMGFSAAAETILTTARRTVGIHSGAVRSVCAGIGGISAGNRIVELCKHLSGIFPQAYISVRSDAEIALSNGLPAKDGCLLLAGTGVIGLVRRGKAQKRFGGFGFYLDHGGSGYDFGRDVFYAVLCAAEGRGPETILTAMVETQTGCRAAEALDEVYRLGRPYLASFAPLAFAAATEQDPVACDIIRRNGAELGSILSAMMSEYETIPCPVVLSGGIFQHFTLLEPYLYSPTVPKDCVIFLRPETPPVYGAAAEAAEMFYAEDRNAAPDFRAKFLESYRTLL